MRKMIPYVKIASSEIHTNQKKDDAEEYGLTTEVDKKVVDRANTK